MPSPPSSVIVVDDSSEDEPAAGGRRSAPLTVSSSDESDSARPSQPKKARVEPPTFSFAQAPKGRSADEDEDDFSDEEGQSDASEISAPRATKKVKAKRKSPAAPSTDSDEDVVQETAPLNFADSDGRMFSDVMSFSELQAQQRELERLRAKAHRKSAAPHNTARRATTAAKRKATSAAFSSPPARAKGGVMKKTTSPSPFDFDFPGSSDESSSSSGEDHASAAGAQAKAMSLKDVVAQERELARMRSKSAKKNNQVAPSKAKTKATKKKTTTTKPAASKTPLFSFGVKKNDAVIDATEWSSSEGEEADSDAGKPKAPLQPRPYLEESFSESDEANSSDEEYMPSKSKRIKASAQVPSVAGSGQEAKAGKTAPQGSKKKSKSKKGKSSAQSSSAKSRARGSLPVPDGTVVEKKPHQRSASDTVMHSTVWRNVVFDTAPQNLLQLDSSVPLPFFSECDRPLLTYDVDGDLRSKCKILPQFGRSTHFDSSALITGEPEQVITQEDVDSRVTDTIQLELPRIRACHRRKTSAIIAEARTKIKAYLAALETQKEGHHAQVNVKRLADLSTLDKSLLNQMKQEKLSQAASLGYANVWGETISVTEELFPRAVNQLPNIRPLSRCTAYIGVKANVRVEDDPILRYKPYFGEDDDGKAIDEAWYDAIGSKDSSSLASGLDGEVNEFLLRLVVRECGPSDKVFSALKKVPGFAQAYSDYSEIKKLDESTRLAERRIKEAKELISSKPAEFPLAKVATLEPLLCNVKDSDKTLEKRFAPPPTYFDSNLTRGHANRGYDLGLRSTDDYTELLVTYRDMFCRMCYVYHCVEHGIEHPLPSHRVDPINPPVHLSPVAMAAKEKQENSKEKQENGDDVDTSPGSCASTVSPPASVGAPESGSCSADDNAQRDEANNHSEDVHTDEDVTMEHETCYETATDEEVTTAAGELHETRRSSRALTRISTMASRSLKKQAVRPSRRKQSRPQRVQTYPQVADESEYLDDSHVDHVTAAVKKSLKADALCSETCWKSENSDTATNGSTSDASSESKPLSDTEVVLLRKLRDIIGDNPCIISSMVKSTTCKEVGAFLESERQSKPIRTSSMDDMPLSPDARLNNTGRKRGRPRNSRNSNNRILLKRTRNNRLKDKNVNHEYEPCNHEGACDTTDCSCMTRDHTCDKACSCPRDCPNRFPGCKCSLGNCRTKACPCFVAARECNPDLCVTCGASEVPALIYDEERKNMSALDLGICCNVNILRGLHKKVGVAYSGTHGWGAFALEPIKRGDFIYEYHGALLSQDEAERRGSIYDKMTISFLFDVDDDSVVDAIRKGNKSKFANHSAVDKKCKGKVLTVAGEHRISIWAQQDIAKGEELFFDYGYHGEAAPDWSQLRIKGARHGPKKKAEGKDNKKEQ